MIKPEAREKTIAQGQSIIQMLDTPGWGIYKSEIIKRMERTKNEVFEFAKDPTKIEVLRDKVKELNILETALKIPEFFLRDATIAQEEINKGLSSNPRTEEREV